MKFFLFITLFLYLSNCLSEDYILEFQAKVKNSIEYNISKTKKFKNYDLEGTFTDSYGNIGTFGAVIIADVDKGRLIRLDSTSENIYSNNERLYLRGIREKSDLDAGIETLPDAFDAPPWAKLEIKKLVKADPFTLDHDAMRFADDLIPLRDGYTQFDITQH